MLCRGKHRILSDPLHLYVVFLLIKRTSQGVINKLLRDEPLHALYRTIWHVPALYNIFISIFLKKRRVIQSISRKNTSLRCMHACEDDHKDFPTKIPDDVDQILTHEYCAVVFTCGCHPPFFHAGVILFRSISPTLNPRRSH